MRAYLRDRRISQEYMRNLLLFCFLTTWSKSILCAVDIMWCVGSYFVRQGVGRYPLDCTAVRRSWASGKGGGRLLSFDPVVLSGDTKCESRQMRVG